ncbi:MAG TPA: PQQ-dependent sugar dehydrogenase [Polyangiaceae bacterium]|nr:PQQ-dependent sugar dehydrogenase [Polyangiaceae bacterium]
MRRQNIPTRGLGLGIVVAAAAAVAAAACGTDNGGGTTPTAGSSAGGTSAAGNGGSAPGGTSSVAGSATGGGGAASAGSGNTMAGTGGSAAGAGGTSGGTGGGNAGGTGGSGGSAGGGGGSGGGAPVAEMCKAATGDIPTFKKVAASDKSIPGAVGVVGNPESPDVIYVPQHFTGDVRIVQGGKLQDAPLLHVDVRQNPPGREQGLLSIAIHPDFTTNHLLYVHYSAANPTGQTTIEEFKLTDATHATSVRKVYQQEHSNQYHNGGTLMFGADKQLYFSIGDNQNDCGPSCAQMAEGPYGRIRKLDVSNQNPQSTVKTFENGLRNPWRWSFDPLTFDVLIGDVGDGGDASEKVFFAKKADAEGKNWGWAPGVLDGRNPAGTITTLASDGAAIIGGVVYRGSNPKMAGACGLIFFGHLKGNVYTIKNDGSAKTKQDALSGTNDLGSFGRDANGEIYLTYLGGQVFRIDAN